MIFKQLIRYTNAPALEATWVNQVGEVVKCHVYSNAQMKELRNALGAEVVKYAKMIDEVEDTYVPPTPQPIPVPNPITRRQGRMALLELHLLDDVEDVIAAIEDPTEKRRAQIEYEAETWDRNSPFLISMWIKLKGTIEGLDEMFRKAASL